MKLNIPIILYLLFLVLVCMNKPKVIEGAIFSSPSNCPTVGSILNRIDSRYDEVCTGTESTPAPTECVLASSMIDFIRNEYTAICSTQPPGLDNTIIPQGGQVGGDGEDRGQVGDDGEDREQVGDDGTVPPEDVYPM